MQIWLVRHATAAERETFQGLDAERPLTDKGRRRFRDFVGWLAAAAPPVQGILTSPLARAEQTAELLRKGFGLKKGTVAVSEALAPGATPQALLALAAQSRFETVALVGHEPDFSETLTAFVGGGRFEFSKGAVAAVDFADSPQIGQGSLRWFVGPKL